MSKPTVGIFSLAYYPFVGGAEIAVKEIADRLPDQDFFVFANRFDRDWLPRERIGNCEIIRLGKGSESKNYYGRPLEKVLYVFRAWRAAEKTHREQPFSAIWAVMASYAGIAALLFKLRHPGIPLLLTLQEGDSEAHILKRVGVFYPLWKRIFKKADHIQAISNFLAEFAWRHGAACPVTVVPNGVDLQKFRAGKKPVDNPGVIITTSRLVPKNGVDLLIEAFAALGGKYELHILGSGPDEPKLKELAERSGASARIRFLGSVEQERLPEYLVNADVFVRASRSEGLGSSFLEAMAAGLPVIGTPVGGIPDFLEDGQTGLFARAGDPADLADKMRRLLENRKLSGEIAERGRLLVEDKYSWGSVGEKMKEIFTALRVPEKTLLLATGIFPPDIGGPATYATLLCQELPKRGFKVKTVTYGPAGISRSFPKGLRHLLFFFACLFRGAGANIIFTQDPISAGLPALIAAKLLGKPFLIRVAGDYAWEQAVQRFGVQDDIDSFQNKKYGWRTELLRRLQRWVVGKADQVITPSKYFQKLVSGWVKNPERIQVIYNGIDLATSDQRLATSKEKLILSAGRLVSWKGFRALIELMPKLPDWRLVIAGDGPEIGNLKSKIENLELADRVRLAGALPRPELLKLLGEASVFVLNTSFESFSFQVVEAMYAGVPVITTNIGNLAEIIENGREGILVEPDNKVQILQAIERVDRDAAFRQTIIKNAQEKSKKFSIVSTLNGLGDLLRNIL